MYSDIKVRLNAVTERERQHYAVAKRLRAKLEVNPKNPKYIIAISGVGYRFKEIS